MRLGRPKVALILTDDERVRLDSLAHRSRTAPHLARRARLILACAEGHENKVVARRFRMSQTTVCKWRARFLRARLDGLYDEPRSCLHGHSALSRASTRRLRPLGVTTIYIDRSGEDAQTPTAQKSGGLRGRTKSVLVILFVPSVERDGKTPIGQNRWVDAALEMFGRTFGGATAYPKAKGI